MISFFRTMTASVLLLLSADSVLGQAVDLASQELGPGYMNFFLAYVVAWVLVMG